VRNRDREKRDRYTEREHEKGMEK
jgi:hypothetical protein